MKKKFLNLSPKMKNLLMAKWIKAICETRIILAGCTTRGAVEGWRVEAIRKNA